jgi:uncharacterized protein
MPETIAMPVGAVVGGCLIRALPANYVRRVPIVAGAVMSMIYAERYWL